MITFHIPIGVVMVSNRNASSRNAPPPVAGISKITGKQIFRGSMTSVNFFLKSDGAK